MNSRSGVIFNGTKNNRLDVHKDLVTNPDGLKFVPTYKPYIVNGCTIWNVHTGVSITYSEHFTAQNFEVFNIAGHEVGTYGFRTDKGNSGTTFNTYIRNNSVDRFDVGMRYNPGKQSLTSNTFSGVRVNLLAGVLSDN